jgi:hypothetical protein
MTDYTNDPRVRALRKALGDWIGANPLWYMGANESGWRQQYRTAEEIAADLAAVLEQMDVRLAGVLESPDGQLIQAVVGSVLPAPQVFLFGLLVDAVLLAAQAKNRNQKIGAGVLAVLVLTMALLFRPRSATTG